jgi:hypothetical protein
MFMDKVLDLDLDYFVWPIGRWCQITTHLA